MKVLNLRGDMDYVVSKEEVLTSVAEIEMLFTFTRSLLGDGKRPHLVGKKMDAEEARRLIDNNEGSVLFHFRIKQKWKVFLSR